MIEGLSADICKADKWKWIFEISAETFFPPLDICDIKHITFSAVIVGISWLPWMFVCLHCAHSVLANSKSFYVFVFLWHWWSWANWQGSDSSLPTGCAFFLSLPPRPLFIAIFNIIGSRFFFLPKQTNGRRKNMKAPLWSHMLSPINFRVWGEVSHFFLLCGIRNFCSHLRS